MRPVLIAALMLTQTLAGCRHSPPDPNEPGLLGGDAIVERICSDPRFARVRLRSRCAPPYVDVVRVRAIVNGHDFAAVAVHDTSRMETDGPARTTLEYTLDGEDETARGFGAVGAVPDVDERTAKRLLEARLLEDYWWRFRSAEDDSTLGAAWPAAAALVAREPAGFARDESGWRLRFWGRTSTRGCRQITLVQAHIDARTGAVARPTGRIYGEPIRNRYAEGVQPARCGLPLDAR